ncbi:hypothetical protein Vi05172_g2185 [Venturia inaequalis]|nr:hypothetical protein Vi05172_g2185 [Venturia inaequalis]
MPERSSYHDSDISTNHASHGSASEIQSCVDKFGALGNLRNTDVAVPQMFTFYDQGRIKTLRPKSIASTPTRKRKSSTRARTRTSRKDEIRTRPEPEHSSPFTPATAPSSSVSAATSWLKTPTNPNTQSEHSPISQEDIDSIASAPYPSRKQRSTGNYPHSSLSVSHQSIAGARSSSRRAKTKINSPVSRQRSSKFLAPPSPSNQEIREISSLPCPRSIGKEDTTALPQYTFSKENLEEQPDAARALQIHLPSLPSPLAQESKASRIATQLYIISYLIFFSIFGTLARLGLSWLKFYPGAPAVPPVLWSNFGGSLILGWLIEDQRVFREEWSSHSPAPQILSTTNRSREIIITGRQHRFQDCPDAVAQHLRVKKTMPLYIGLAVGFCGPFTSF